MKQGLVEMVFILDCSGSMYGLASDTIGGYNSMIEKQKREPGEAFVTTVLFNDEYKLLHDHVNLKDIGTISNKEYSPSGMTALLDAIGRTINSIGARLAATPEGERPEKVMFMVTTDGMENASKEFTYAKVKEMIEHQQNKYNWVFIFLGANIDAVGEAEKLGIRKDFARNYTNSDKGVGTVYAATSNVMSKARGKSYATLDAMSADVAKDLDSVE